MADRVGLSPYAEGMTGPNPPAGWYPNPDGTGGLRWWDATAWTGHTTGAVADEAVGQPPPADPGEVPEPDTRPPDAVQPNTLLGAAAWDDGLPAAPPVVGPYAPAYSGAGHAAPRVVASGMRDVSALFTDAGRILTRSWWRLAVICFAIWLPWTAVMALLVAALVDWENLGTALATLSDTMDLYASTPLAADVQSTLEEQFAAVPKTEAPWVWWAAGLFALALSMLALATQVAASNRAAMDASSDLPVRLGAALRAGWRGGWRLFWYSILIAAVMTLLMAGAVGLVAASAQVVPALGVAVGILLGLAALALMVLAIGRLVPLTAQAAVSGGALRWSWRATKGRFWAVFGRYLLWSIVASVIANIVTSVLLIPLGLAALPALGSGDPASYTGWLAALAALSVPVSMLATTITAVGVVPIWRDLTDLPEFRATPVTA